MSNIRSRNKWSVILMRWIARLVAILWAYVTLAIVLFVAAVGRRMHLRRPRPPGPHAGGHRAQAGCLRRHAGNVCVSEPGIRSPAVSRPGGGRADDGGRDRDAQAAR